MPRFEDIHWIKGKISQLQYSKREPKKEIKYYQNLIEKGSDAKQIRSNLKLEMEKLARINAEIEIYKETIQKLNQCRRKTSQTSKTDKTKK